MVEDERQMAELLRRGLTEEGHAVDVAYTGPDGVSLAESIGYDVIVLDVMLPGLSGLDVARRLRGGRNRTPILLLTARDTNADIVAGLDAGADDYLVKPFSFEVLLARLRAVTRRGRWCGAWSCVSRTSCWIPRPTRHGDMASPLS
jgi:DNA-binding response OmpR family regulator